MHEIVNAAITAYIGGDLQLTKKITIAYTKEMIQFLPKKENIETLQLTPEDLEKMRNILVTLFNFKRYLPTEIEKIVDPILREQFAVLKLFTEKFGNVEDVPDLE